MHRYCKIAWSKWRATIIICFFCGFYIVLLPTDHAIVRLFRPSTCPHSSQPISACFDVLNGSKYERGHCTLERMGKNLRELQLPLNGKLILMIGDSRTMQLFRYVRSLLSGRFYEERLFTHADPVASFTDSDRNFTMQFYFLPYPDQEAQEIIHEWTVVRKRKPDYLFYETGVWSVYLYGPKSRPEFKKNLTSIADKMAGTRDTTIPIWIRTLPVHPQVPFRHTRGRRHPWVNVRYNNTDLLIESFGQIVEDVALMHNFTVWTSAHHLAKQNPKLYRDQIHPGLSMLRLPSIAPLAGSDNKIYLDDLDAERSSSSTTLAEVTPVNPPHRKKPEEYLENIFKDRCSQRLVYLPNADCIDMFQYYFQTNNNECPSFVK